MALVRINRNPSPAQLLTFTVAGCSLAAVAGIIAWRHSHAVRAEIAGAALALLLLTWLTSRPLLRAIYLGLTYATYPIGFIVSHVVLAVVYYVVLTPIGLLLRACGRDPLARTFDRSAPTYWQPRLQNPPPAEYFKQG